MQDGVLLVVIKHHQYSFTHITFSHVYKESNKEVDRISKDVLKLQEVNWEIKGSQQGQISTYFYESWI
jgi:hypothetical protein